LMTLWYFNTQDAAGLKTSFADSIVPNLATELFGVWLSVRIIESVLRQRQKRSQLRSQLIENMNYLVTLIRSIAPHFEQQTIDHLTSELKWFEEMKDYRISGTSEQTIRLINEVTRLYKKAATEALKINPMRDNINDLFLSHPEMLEDADMKELHDVYRRQNYTRIIVDRIDSRIESYKEKVSEGEPVEKIFQEQEVIQKIEDYSSTLKIYISITLDAEAAVLEARSSVMNREYNF